MKKKKSEIEFKDLCRRLNLHWHKFADILKCPNCNMVIWQSKNMPDFEVAHCGLKTVVEVKQGSSAYGAWAFGDPNKGIRPNQRKSMNMWWNEQGVMPWLFVVLGNGRAPKERGAFLIPWETWKTYETDLLHGKQKSIRLMGGRKRNAVDLFPQYRLDWVKSNDDHPGGWDLPWDHCFNLYLNQAEQALKIRNQELCV